MLKQQSIKQGQAYDSTVGVLPHIQAFIAQYDIPVDELLITDLSEYKTFNEFFARALKPSARPPASPGDASVVSSAADCRLQVYPTVAHAQEFWIKGNNFTLANLFGDEQLASEFEGGALAIFRVSSTTVAQGNVAQD